MNDATKIEPAYLGDALYASDDGYHVVLTTGNHEPAFASNVVYIDPEGVEGLLAYIARWKAARKAAGVTA